MTLVQRAWGFVDFSDRRVNWSTFSTVLLCLLVEARHIPAAPMGDFCTTIFLGLWRGQEIQAGHTDYSQQREFLSFWRPRLSELLDMWNSVSPKSRQGSAGVAEGQYSSTSLFEVICSLLSWECLHYLMPYIWSAIILLVLFRSLMASMVYLEVSKDKVLCIWAMFLFTQFSRTSLAINDPSWGRDVAKDMHLYAKPWDFLADVIILEPQEPEIIPLIPDPEEIKHLLNIESNSYLLSTKSQ